MTKKIVMTRDDIRRTLARISHEIIEQNKSMDHLILVGMRTRGVPLARRLAANIQKTSPTAPVIVEFIIRYKAFL